MKTTIQKICNYTEDTKNPYQPTISLAYMDFLTEDEDELQRELKRQNRDLAIDILLDEKDESEWENRNNLPQFDGGFTTVMSPKLFSVNTIAKNFTSFENLEYEVFTKLENLTKNQPTSNNTMMNNLNINIANLNSSYDFEALQRRVVSKIMVCKNIVTMESRKGLANTIIVGINVAKYIEIRDTNINNMFIGLDIVVTPYIDKDKIIVMRVEEKTMKWFWVK